MYLIFLVGAKGAPCMTDSPFFCLYLLFYTFYFTVFRSAFLSIYQALSLLSSSHYSIPFAIHPSIFIHTIPPPMLYDHQSCISFALFSYATVHLVKNTMLA